MADLILASGSPRRKELLHTMGLHDFIVCTSDVDETVSGNPTPSDMVCTLSARKAGAVAAEHPESIIIAADTVVAIDGCILGKPKDESDAFQMLRTLSGRAHQVFTGVTVQRGTAIVTTCEATDVYFRELTDEEISSYIRGGEPMDKAGAYGIQGQAGIFVEKISGDFFNVVGLPICLLAKMLKGFDIDPLSAAN